MNKEDKIRFARYYPGYIETNSDIENKTIDNTNTNNNTNNNNNNNNNKLGYINEIKIDKNELIENIIKSKTTT